MFERDGDLRGDDGQEALFAGWEVRAVQFEHGAFAYWDGRVSAVGEGFAGCYQHRVPFAQSHASQGERFAGALHERLDGVLSSQDTSGDGLDEFGFGGSATCDACLSSCAVDDEADQHCDGDVQGECKKMEGIVDGDGVERFDEEEVQGEPGQHGSEQGGPDPSDESDDDDEQLVAEHIAGDGLGAAEGREQPGESGAADQGEDHPGDAAFHGQRAAAAGQGEASAGGGVGDDVHVDVAGLADDRGTDTGAGERRAEPAAAADADHELCRVEGPGELDERVGDVVPDDLVIRTAELVNEGALRR